MAARRAKQVKRKPKPKPKPKRVRKGARRPAPRPQPEPVPLDEAEFGAGGGMSLAEADNKGSDRSRARHAVQELTWAEFDRQVQALARAAAQRFKPTAVVGLAHGGVFVGGAVASALKVDFFPVRLSRRSRDHSASTHPLAQEMPRELKGKRVLVVDDVAGSGDSLDLALRLAKAAGATALSSAALVGRAGGFEPDFLGSIADAFVVFPWDYQPVVEDGRFGSDG
jgi:hypoxanthine phosphoribosyltransferase